MARTGDTTGRKLLLSASLCTNLGLLGFFKYFNFFADSFTRLLNVLGMQADPVSLRILLPIGISFYTFQTLSYTIDVYRGKVEPTRDLIAFFAFVSFFPQLVAGPIERAETFLPQFHKKRAFELDEAVDGCRQILWGFFKKIAVADVCGAWVNEIWAGYHTASGAILVVGAFLFTFQVYGDFSGYSDICIGTGRLFGFRLMRNFAYPLFARDMSEFWRRWHISLSTWFRDYLYFPLGGNRVAFWEVVRNVMIVFIVSGLWHGAAWHFVVFGFLHGVYLTVVFAVKRERPRLDIVAAGRTLPTVRETLAVGVTFSGWVLSLIFFRAPSVRDAFGYLGHLFNLSVAGIGPDLIHPVTVACFMLVWEWFQREKQHGLQFISLPRPLRHLTYVTLITIIVWFPGRAEEFIYFQF